MFYPKPPLEPEKYSYSYPNGISFSIPGLLLIIGFIVSTFCFFSKSILLISYLLIPYLLFSIVYILNIGFTSIGSLLAKDFDIKKHEELKEEAIDFLPSVDIYLPSCGEPINLLAVTFKAIKEIDYPNYNVWVLDDAHNPELKILAEINGFEYIAREDKGVLKKSGNMRNAFKITTGEFILVFDADFAPRSDFLKETIPYLKDEKLAILQSSQYFQLDESQTLIAKGSTYVQEVFYRLIQNFRDLGGYSVCTGSCAIYRRKALEPFGGSYPVERSEDVNTGLSVLRTGWKIKYLPLNLSAGLSPDTIKAFFHQQYRWCSGSLHLVTSELFWNQPISIVGKLCYLLSILYYICSGLGTFFFNFPSLINIWFYPQDFAISNYSLIVPGLLSSILIRGVWSTNKWGYYVLLTGFVAGYSHLTAIIDVVSGNVAPWIPTGAADTVVLKRDNFKLFKRLSLFIPLFTLFLYLLGIYYNREYIDVNSWQLSPLCFFMFIQLSMQYFMFKEILKDEENLKENAIIAENLG